MLIPGPGITACVGLRDDECHLLLGIETSVRRATVRSEGLMPSFRIGVRAKQRRRTAGRKRAEETEDFAPLPNSCLFPGDAYFFSPRRGLRTSPLPQFVFITRFSYTRFQGLRTPFHTFSPSTQTSSPSSSSHLSHLPVDDVSDRLWRLSLCPSPLSDVRELEQLFDLSEQEELDDDASTEPEVRDSPPVTTPVTQSQQQVRDLSPTVTEAAAPDPAVESESPISRRKKSSPASSAASSDQIRSQSSQKRSAESSSSSEDDGGDPLHETFKKKPILRFRKLRVARHLFEQTPLEHVLERMDIRTPDEGDEDEEPISIKSGSECSDTTRSFFLTKSPEVHSSPIRTPVMSGIRESPPESWNSHSCEHSHGQSMSELTQ